MMIKEKAGITGWIGYVGTTRTYGSTYIHMVDRGGLDAVLDGRAVRFDWGWYGRSSQGGGHKHKAHCNYLDNSRPVDGSVDWLCRGHNGRHDVHAD